MPFYRFPTGKVHVRGTKMPPPCDAKIRVGKAGLDAAFQCVRCMAMSEFLCDWPVTNARGKSGTCDAALCNAHSGEVGPNKNYCPEHLQLHRQQQGPGLFTHLVES